MKIFPLVVLRTALVAGSGITRGGKHGLNPSGAAAPVSMYLLVDKIPGAGKCENEYQDCADIRSARIHDLREETQKDEQEAETDHADDNIKESFVHCIRVVPAPLNQYPHHLT